MAAPLQVHRGAVEGAVLRLTAGKRKIPLMSKMGDRRGSSSAPLGIARPQGKRLGQRYQIARQVRRL